MTLYQGLGCWLAACAGVAVGSCASVDERVLDCVNSGGVAVLSRAEKWHTTCDCDLRSTFIDCPSGTTVTMGKENGSQQACGLTETTIVGCKHE
jgi:hypothetical protein